MAEKENLNLGSIVIIKICLIGFLLSFCLLFFLEKNIEIEVKNISDISFRDLNENGVFIGKFKDIRVNSEIFFGEFYDSSGSFKVVAFEYGTHDKYDIIKLGIKYKLKGKIRIYKNELEIIAEEISEFE